MHIHEYQGKILLKKREIPSPPFAVAATLDEASQAIDFLDLDLGVVKAQIHAGARGKGGGIKLGLGKKELLGHVKELLGKHLVTPQTDSKGLFIEKVMITPQVAIARELYLGLALDRSRRSVVLSLSRKGGINIEEEQDLLLISIPPEKKLRSYHVLEIRKYIALEDDLFEKYIKIIREAIDLYFLYDLSLLEINPLVETRERELVALDCKISIDENALFRHPDLAKFYDPSQLPIQEQKAKELDLAYVALEGNIGCVVNGAGLAMATVDLIHEMGGKAANFLDVGGSATVEKIGEGIKLILKDPHVKTLFVNIFGGIMNCQTVAEGVIQGMKGASSLPIIVRMEGTNVEAGKELLRSSNLDVEVCDTQLEAVKRVICLS